MNEAILGEGGTVMQFVGDAVMAVFGAPFAQPDHADRAVVGRGRRCTRGRLAINARWAGRGSAGLRARASGCPPGRRRRRSSGRQERLEYTLVGDTVNLSQRLQQLAAAGETVLSEATLTGAAATRLAAVPLAAAAGQRAGHSGGRLQIDRRSQT